MIIVTFELIYLDCQNVRKSFINSLYIPRTREIPTETPFVDNFA